MFRKKEAESSDAGILTMVADPFLNNYDPLENMIMDWSGALADGTVISGHGVLLNEFMMQTPNYRYCCADDTVAYACSDEYDQLFIP